MEGQSLRFSSASSYRYPYCASKEYPYNFYHCAQAGHMPVPAPYFPSLPSYGAPPPPYNPTPSCANTVPPYYKLPHSHASGPSCNVPSPSSCTNCQTPRSSSPAVVMVSAYPMHYMPRPSPGIQQTFPPPLYLTHPNPNVRPHQNQSKTPTHLKKPSVISTNPHQNQSTHVKKPPIISTYDSLYSVAVSDSSSRDSSLSEAVKSEKSLPEAIERENESDENIEEGQMLIRGSILNFKSNGTEIVLATGGSLHLTIQKDLLYVNGKKVGTGKLLWDILSLGSHLKAVIKEREVCDAVNEVTKKYTAVIAWFGDIPTLRGFTPTVRQLSEEEEEEEDSHEIKTYSNEFKEHVNSKPEVTESKEILSHIIGYMWWADKEIGILRVYDSNGWESRFTGVLFTANDLHFDGQQASCDSLHLLIAHVNKCEVQARKVHPRVVFGLEVKWEAVHVECGKVPSSLKNTYLDTTGSDSSHDESLPDDKGAGTCNSDDDLTADLSFNTTEPLTKRNGGSENIKPNCSPVFRLGSDCDELFKQNHDVKYQHGCKRNESKDEDIRKELKTKIDENKEFDHIKREHKELHKLHHFHRGENIERKSVVETLFGHKKIVCAQNDKECSLNGKINKNCERVSAECLPGLLNDASISDVTTDFEGKEYSGKHLTGHIVELFSAEEGFGIAECPSITLGHTFIKFKQDHMFFNCVPLNRMLYIPPAVYSKCCNLYVLPVKSENCHDYSSVRFYATCGWIGSKPVCVPSPGKQSHANVSLSHSYLSGDATVGITQNCEGIKKDTKLELKTSSIRSNDVNSNCAEDFRYSATSENNMSRSHNIMSSSKTISCLNTSVDPKRKELKLGKTRICLASRSNVSENSTVLPENYSVVSTNMYSTPSSDTVATRSTYACSTSPIESSTPSSDITTNTRIPARTASLLRNTLPFDDKMAISSTSECSTSPPRSTTPSSDILFSGKFVTDMNEKQDLLTGIVIEVHLNMGRLEAEDGTQYYFSRDNCYLHGISLQRVELWHILVHGQQIQFRLDMTSANRAKVTEVVIASCHVDSSHKVASYIHEWCKNNAVPDVARDLLVEQLQ